MPGTIPPEIQSPLAAKIVPPILALSALYSGLSLLSRNNGEHALTIFVVTMFAAFLVLLWAFRQSFDIKPRTVLMVAALFHFIGLAGMPLFEDDHYRYLWDGYRFVVSGSPYGAAPAEFFADENVPAPMCRILDGVNYPDIPTIYAPVLQYFFGLSYLIAPGALWPLKTLLILANLTLIALLLRSASPRMVLLYAWNPLVFKEVAMTAHPDALVALPLLMVWHYRGTGGMWLKGWLFGLTLAVKIVAAPAMAWLLWRGRHWAIVVAGLSLLATYLPFAGSANDLQGLATFAQGWRFNAVVYAWLLEVLEAPTAKYICLGISILAMFAIQFHARNSDDCPPWHRVFGIFLLFSPVINAWYLLWLLPFAVYSRDIWPWAASAAVCLSYVTGLNTDREDIEAFALLPWAQTLEWVLIGLALCADIKIWSKYRSRKRTMLLKREEG